MKLHLESTNHRMTLDFTAYFSMKPEEGSGQNPRAMLALMIDDYGMSVEEIDNLFKEAMKELPVGFDRLKRRERLEMNHRAFTKKYMRNLKPVAIQKMEKMRFRGLVDGLPFASEDGTIFYLWHDKREDFPAAEQNVIDRAGTADYFQPEERVYIGYTDRLRTFIKRAGLHEVELIGFDCLAVPVKGLKAISSYLDGKTGGTFYRVRSMLLVVTNGMSFLLRTCEGEPGVDFRTLGGRSEMEASA